jgi:ribosomal protein L28
MKRVPKIPKLESIGRQTRRKTGIDGQKTNVVVANKGRIFRILLSSPELRQRLCW